MSTPAPEDQVLILTPTGADPEVAAMILSEAGVPSSRCDSIPEVCEKLSAGAAALLVAEEALAAADCSGLVHCLGDQPPWSDIPLIVLTSGDDAARSAHELATVFGSAGNITLLERPFRAATLVSTVRVAVRARRKQYEVRRLLESEAAAKDEAAEAAAKARASEAELRVSEERFRVALKSAPLIVYTTDLELRYTWIHRPHAAFEAADILGRRDDELLGPEAARELIAFKQQALDTGQGARRQIELAIAGKREIYDITVEPLRDAEGRLLGLTVAAFDVTERFLAEERFRQLADSIPQLAWMAKPDGWIFWYNHRWHEYTGTTPQQMEGWGWQTVHDPAVLPSVMERWRRSISSGEPFDMTFPIKGADGVFRPFLTRVMPFRDHAGNVLLWFGTNTDVTEQRRLAEEREHLLESERAARAESERAGRMKDEFLATLSHELRTPLNAILGWSQLIRRGGQDAKTLDEGLTVIERNARVQVQLIEDLLDMSRIISGKVRLDVQPVEPETFIDAAVETVAPAAEAKGIRLQKVLDPLAGPISGDPGRLQQVVWNLLSNAIKFTPKGGKVQVILERVNSHIELSVADTGQGIRPEFLPHVFERFRQADASTTRRHGGLGLGLAIVKHLVELHGGTIRAKSPGEGKGSTFTVMLPVAVVHRDGQEQKRSHPKAPKAAPAEFDCMNLEGVRVLVVDDEQDARELIRRVLEECRVTVLTAASAPEAMEVLRREKPDVLVSDIGMPGVDGYEFLRQVRRLPREEGGRVPAVALTAFARSEDRTRALRAGYLVHVSKPVEPSELVATVASVAGRTGGPAE